MSEIFQTLLPGNETIEQPRFAGAGRVLRVDRRRRDFVAGLPIAESESVQLGPGRGEYVSRRVCGRDLVILCYKWEPKLVVHSVPNEDWVVLLMPLNERSEFVFNGRVARPLELLLSAGRDRAWRRVVVLASAAAVAAVGIGALGIRSIAARRAGGQATGRGDRHGQRARGGIAARQQDGRVAGQRGQPLREVVQPGLVTRRQGQRKQEPGRLGAHRREVAEVDGQGLVADRARVGAGRKMHALDQCIGAHREVLAGGRPEQGRVVANPEQAAAAVRVPPPRKKRRAAQLDSRTLKDIGVEPGSITWL